MGQHLFILLVFTGVAPFVLSVSRRYFLNQSAATWSDAQAYCQATYIDLAIIESNDDVVQIQNEAQRQQFSSSAWIGLYNDINSWRWSLGNEPVGKITHWVPGQPSNKLGNQTCVSVVTNGWDDQNCAALHPSICFDEINYEFTLIPTMMTWYEAQSYCRQHYTDLAITRNETETSIVQGLQSSSSSYYVWIGLFRDAWKWIDKTNFSTITWMPGKPDNALGKEDCGYLTNIQAEDDQCISVKPFFCFSEVRKQHVIRIKVQSNQDVNELKAAIIGQIEQKLKDNGMTDEVTVEWRAQRDGIVFHKKERREKIIVGLFNCV